MIREGTRWHEVSWKDALDRAADGLVRVRRRDGRDAVAIYYGNPVAHNLGLLTHALPFARALRTRNVYSASSADRCRRCSPRFECSAISRSFRCPIWTGPICSSSSAPIRWCPRQPDDRSRHQRPASRHPRPRRPRRRGRPAPHRNRGHRRRARRHPAGDGRLAARGHAHVVFAEGLVRLGRFADHVSHLESLAALVHEFPPARVARRTGVGAETIRQLALDFAHTTRAACYSRVGLCTSSTARWRPGWRRS